MPDRRPTEFRIGRKYRLRSGAVVTIVECRMYRWRNTFGVLCERPIWVWEGDGIRSTMEPDGYFAPECGQRPHPNDIVARVFG